MSAPAPAPAAPDPLSGPGPGVPPTQDPGLHGAPPVSQVIEERTEQVYTPCFFRFITAITRVWTLLTIIALWIVTVSLIHKKEDFKYTPWYMLVVSIFISLFELIWVFDKCAKKFRDDGCLCCCRLWRALVWIDNWKKSILYTMLAVPCFLDGVVAWQAILCGLFILIIAFLYFMKSFQESKCIHRKKYTSKYTRITSMEAGVPGNSYGATTAEQPPIPPTQDGGPDAPQRPASPPARPVSPPARPVSPPQPQPPSNNPFDESQDSTAEGHKP